MPPNNDKQHQPTTGIKYPKHRDAPYKNVDLWLKDKGRDDNAEGFWRIHDKLYDLSQFVLSHPGGPDWIKYTKVIYFIFLINAINCYNIIGHGYN